MLTSYNPEYMDTEGEIFKKIEERTNTDLTITWVPSSTYPDKVSATVASGELPSAILTLDQKLPYIVNAVRSGMFWEVGPYLKDYPNLSRMNENALHSISIDGKVYGLYRGRDIARDGEKEKTLPASFAARKRLDCGETAAVAGSRRS